MPQNDSHIVELESWHASAFHCGLKRVHQRIGNQPMMQLKFVASNSTLVIEWGEVRTPSVKDPLRLATDEFALGENWTLKGRLVIRHEDIAVATVRGGSGALFLDLRRQPSLRWGEQTWNSKMKRNNRTQWVPTEPQTPAESRWPMQFRALKAGTLLSFLPKSKHMKKLLHLADLLIGSAPRMKVQPGSKVEDTVVAACRQIARFLKKKTDSMDKRKPTSPRGGYSSPKKRVKASRLGASSKVPSLGGAPSFGDMVDSIFNSDADYGAGSASSQQASSSGSGGGLKTPKRLADERTVGRSQSTPGTITSKHGQKSGKKSRGASSNDKPRAKKRQKPAMSHASMGITMREFNLLKPAPVVSDLEEIVREVGHLADKNWDGRASVKQAGFVVAFFKKIEAPIQSVIDVGVVKGKGQQRCHELLLAIAEVWSKLKAVKVAGGVKDLLKNQHGASIQLTVPRGLIQIPGVGPDLPATSAKESHDMFIRARDGHVDRALMEAWRMLLIAAAEATDAFGYAHVSDSAIFQFIKDVVDFFPHLGVKMILQTDGRHGRLLSLFNQRGQWECLPSMNKGSPFSTPDGGSIFTVASAGPSAQAHLPDKDKYMSQMYLRQTAPHIRNIKRSDSWDSFLGADDSPY